MCKAIQEFQLLIVFFINVVHVGTQAYRHVAIREKHAFVDYS